MSMNFRSYTDKDLERVVALYIDCLGDHVPNTFIQKLLSGEKSVLDWKYGYGNSTRFVAEIDNRIIGHHGSLSRKMIFKDEEIDAVELVDLMVHPDFRNRGIATEIERHHEGMLLNKGVDFILRFPNNINGGRIRRKRNDYIPLSSVPLLGKKKLTHQSSKDVYQTDRFNEKLDELFAKVKDNFGITTIRNKSYLNWRFFDNPINEYHIYIQKHKQGPSDIQGYVVLKIYDTGTTKIGDIIDILADSSETLANLINFGEDYFAKKGINSMAAYIVPKSYYAQNFLEHGFIGEEIGRTLFIKPLDKKLEAFCKAESLGEFHITMMDHDVY